MDLSLKNYVAALCQSKLVTESDLRRILKELHQKHPAETITVDQVSEELMEVGLITPWQHQRLVEGNVKGFLFGHYRLLGELGEGGMGKVFLAEHDRMKRKCALKVLSVPHYAPGSVLKRFKHEAMAMAKLDHPNLIRAYDYDCEGNIHYLVMEAVGGQDLDKVVDLAGPLSIERAVDYIQQAATGLAYAHSQKIVHRDVKPSNLLVTGEEQVKILDLGLALLNTTSVGSLTREFNEHVVGTANYMSPEQALDSHEVDHRADIYSLGCTLVYLLTGKPPFEATTLPGLLLKHQTAKLPPLSEFRADVPDNLEHYINWMMQKKPESRPQTMEEVADWLFNWQSDPQISLPVDAPREEIEEVFEVFDVLNEESKIESLEPIASRKNLIAIASWIAGFTVLVCLLWVGWTFKSNKPPVNVSVENEENNSGNQNAFADPSVAWTGEKQINSSSEKSTPTVATPTNSVKTAVNSGYRIRSDKIASGNVRGTLVIIDPPNLQELPATGPLGPDWGDEVNDGWQAMDGVSIFEIQTPPTWEMDGTSIEKAKTLGAFKKGGVFVAYTFQMTDTSNLTDQGIDLPDGTIINKIYTSWSAPSRNGVRYNFRETTSGQEVVSHDSLPKDDLVLRWTDSTGTEHLSNFQKLNSEAIIVSGGDGFQLLAFRHGNSQQTNPIVLDVTLPLTPLNASILQVSGGADQAINLVNGSGITKTEFHSDEKEDMWQTTSLPTTLIFDLGDLFQLQRIHVWNYNEKPNFRKGRDRTNAGARDVEISVSPTNNLDDLILLSHPKGAFEFSKAPGTTNYQGFRVDLQSELNSTHLEKVRIVQFKILSIHGEKGSVGLSEVQFFGEKSLPE